MALKVAKAYTETLKGQNHQPWLHLHGEWLKLAVLETLQFPVQGSAGLLNYKHMHPEEENHLYFYYKKTT